ncbi:trypsin eta-like isoform X2 [Cloeon dipterum]|uniref:trypsin eta-like isoform X2 n=1 Tax=Cloeon dipterum TaxID=197152 RepID=UPI0032208309
MDRDMLRTLVVGIALLVGAHAGVIDSDEAFEGRFTGGASVTPLLETGYIVTIIGTSSLDGVNPTTCGGVIINTTLILTTATCVYKMQSAVLYAGYKNVSADNSANNQTVYMVDKFINPNWEINTGLNDIALIKVYPPFYFNEYVYPIALPKSSVVKGDAVAKVGNLTWFSFGSINNTDNLTLDTIQFAKVTYLSSRPCSSFYIKPPYWFSVPTSMLCLNLTEIGYCNLDNGYPLIGYAKDTKTKIFKPFLVALAAQDRDNFCPQNASVTNFNTPDLFTRIDSSYKWIAANGGPSIQ